VNFGGGNVLLQLTHREDIMIVVFCIDHKNVTDRPVKIDPKLKNRIRFNQLDGDAKERLRRFYHVTSADSALRILQSGFIWSDAPDLAPNFGSNRTTKPEFNGSQQIWLTFNFVGPVHLVAEEFSASEYTPNSLYVHLFEWPDMFGLEGMRVDRLRVSQGTSAGLECVGFNASPNYLERCKSDIEATLLLTRIKRMAALSRNIRVPSTPQEREAVKVAYPKIHFTGMDVQKMKFQLWKRRMLKQFQGSGN
jgi:hypothetical protein